MNIDRKLYRHRSIEIRGDTERERERERETERGREGERERERERFYEPRCT